jgi:hypothetical protein
MFVAQQADALDDPARIEVTRLGTDADRQGPRIVGMSGGERCIEQPVEQHQRQVVDDLPAEILQRLQHRRLACARQTGDEQDVLGHRAYLIRAWPRVDATPILS